MTIVVVNRHKVAANRKTGGKEPVLRISRGRYGKPHYAESFEFGGPGRLVYDPEHPCRAARRSGLSWTTR
jgi:hypothetical protein